MTSSASRSLQLFALALTLTLGACEGETVPAVDGGTRGDGGFVGHDAGPIGGSCETGCTGFSYCDVFSNTCRAGCGDDTACGANEFCELTARTCECTPGAHACGDACVDSASPATCGDRCEPCPTVANADAVCASGSCDFACRAGFEECGGACVSCPTSGVAATGCAGSTCIATACSVGYGPCATGCCRWETAAIALPAASPYDARVLWTGTELRGVVNDGSSLVEIRGARSSWTLTSHWEVNPPFAISAQGPTLVGITGQELTSLVGSTWTVAPETTSFEIRTASCGSHPVGGSICLAGDQYAARLYRLSTSGAWSDRVDVGDYPLIDADVAVDAAGTWHVVTSSNYHVAYWHGDGFTPVYEHPRSENGAVRILLDASGDPHLFVNGEPVEHVYRRGGTWRSEPIFARGANGRGTIDAAIDASGNIHVAFGTFSDFRYAVYDGTGWRTSVVEASGSADAVNVVMVGAQPHLFAANAVIAPGSPFPEGRFSTYWLP